MTTVFPGALDSYTDKVDGVDDVLAAHVNDMQDAIEAIELHLQTKGMMTSIRNTSGATVAANDVGYIDYAGEFKTTTTENLVATWCVVVSGAANNSDIVVCRQGRVTVELNGNCSAGDYLYTSTTTGQAQPQSYVRPEVFAVAITANTGGAGGTCTALLLTQRTKLYISPTSDILTIDNSSDSDWQTTMNGNAAAAVITYNVALTNGSENTIVPAATTQLCKTMLWNTTKNPDEYALIDDVDIGANTITVTDADDISGWLDTEVIEARSKTNTSTIFGDYFFDTEIENATVIPELATELGLFLALNDSAGPNAAAVFHPYEANASYKRQTYKTQVVAVTSALASVPIPIIQRRFCLARSANAGAGTFDIATRLQYVMVASP